MLCPPDNQAHLSYSLIERFAQLMEGTPTHIVPEVSSKKISIVRVFRAYSVPVPAHSVSQRSPVTLLDRVRQAEKKQQVTATPVGHNSKLFFKALPAVFIQEKPEGIGGYHANILRFGSLNNPTGSLRY